ncbi:MAG: HNH endonuclease [Spirochaetota bacterium]
MKRKERRYRKHRQDEILHFSEMPPVDIAAEKRKARALRHSAWWKRRIAEGKCYYCGAECDPSELTMDHRIPLARGGLSEKINLAPCCKECNSRKKYMLPAEWTEYIQSIEQDGTNTES